MEIKNRIIKFIHKWHDESKANWHFVGMDFVKQVEELENTNLYHAMWIVKCKCGYTTERYRAYFVWDGDGKRYSHYKTFADCMAQASLYKGDNYHL